MKNRQYWKIFESKKKLHEQKRGINQRINIMKFDKIIKSPLSP